MNNLKFRVNNKPLLLISAFVFILILPLVFWSNEPPPTDCANYYAPMIEAISEGNWTHGYWWGIQPFFTSVGGFFAWLLGLDGFTAAKLTSAFFYALIFIPLFKLNRLVFSERIAWLSLGLLFCCSRMMRYAGSGIQDTGKTFFLTWIVYETISYCQQGSWAKALRLAVAGFGLTLIRPEGAFLGPLFLLGLFVWEFLRGEARFKPLKTLSAGLLCLWMLTPWIYFQYYSTGTPALGGVQKGYLKPVFNELGLFVEATSQIPQEPQAIREIMARPVEKPPEDYLGSNGFYEDVLVEVFKGLMPLYMLLYLPVLWQRIAKRKMTASEWALVGVVVFHTLFFIAATKGLWTQKRYIIAVLPLLLGWSALGLDRILSWLHRYWPRKVYFGLIGLVLISGYVAGVKDLRGPSSKRKQKALEDLYKSVCWFKEQAANDDSQPLLPTEQHYYAKSSLVICSDNPKLAYLAGATNIELKKYGDDLNPDEILAILREKRVDFVVIDDKILSESEAMQVICEGLSTQVLGRFKVISAEDIGVNEFNVFSQAFAIN